MDPMIRRRTDQSDSSNTSSNSSKSNSSSIFKRRKVPSWDKEAQEQERAACPALYQWKCPRYNLTWAELEQFLRRRFPNETFQEFQSGDYWIFHAPEAQTKIDHDEFARLRPRTQPHPHQPRRRARSPE